MFRAERRCRRFMRRAQRRGRVLVRSLLLHVLVLALVGLGLLARMSESSDVQLAAAEHAAALAQLDPSAPQAPLPYAARGWSPPVPILRRLGFHTVYEIEQERRQLLARKPRRDLVKRGSGRRVSSNRRKAA